MEPGRWYRFKIRARGSVALASGVRVLIYNSTQSLGYNAATLAWEAASGSKHSIIGDATTSFADFEVTFLVPAEFGASDTYAIEVHYWSATTGQSSITTTHRPRRMRATPRAPHR
jgi:hypothetical protein